MEEHRRAKAKLYPTPSDGDTGPPLHGNPSAAASHNDPGFGSAREGRAGSSAGGGELPLGAAGGGAGRNQGNAGTSTYSARGSSSSSPSYGKKTQLDGMAGAILLALKFLPLDAAPMAVLVTDGVADYPTPMEYDGLSMRLCRDDVAVSCILVDRIGASTTGSIGVSASGKRGGCETDRRGLDFLPHDGEYASARRRRVPDLNGLTHVVGVSGGWFYDLETLERITAATQAGNTRGSGADDGGGGGGGGSPPSGTRDCTLGRILTSEAIKAVKAGPGDGPSSVLCQVRLLMMASGVIDGVDDFGDVLRRGLRWYWCFVKTLGCDEKISAA